MASNLEFVNYKQFVENLSSVDSAESTDKSVVCNPSDGPRSVLSDAMSSPIFTKSNLLNGVVEEIYFRNLSKSQVESIDSVVLFNGPNLWGIVFKTGSTVLSEMIVRSAIDTGFVYSSQTDGGIALIDLSMCPANTSKTFYTGVSLKSIDYRFSPMIAEKLHNGDWNTFDVGSGYAYATLRAAVEEAVKYNNSKVIIHNGTYDLISEFSDKLSTLFGGEKIGIMLDKGVHIIAMDGVKITAIVPDDGTYTDEQLSKFSELFNPFYPKWNDGSFTLENIEIEAANTRYCVHDEHGGVATYCNKYINCKMKFSHTISRNTVSHFVGCIGGGLGEHGTIVIDGGRYEAHTVVGADHIGGGDPDNHQNCISYHNGDNANADSYIRITNVYLADRGYIKFGYYGASTVKSLCEVSGCSFGLPVIVGKETNSALSANANFEVVTWDNEQKVNGVYWKVGSNGYNQDLEESPDLNTQFTDNEELNSIIRELFVDPSDVSYVSPDALVKCRVMNGYLIGGVARYGALFYNGSNQAKLELYSTTNSPIQNFRESYGVFDLSKVTSGTYKDYAMSLTSLCTKIEFSPYIKEYVTSERLDVIFTNNDKANAYVKELYIDPSDMTDANIANVAKIRVYNGYAGNRHGITLVDSSNNTLFSIINTTDNSSLQTVSKSGVVLDYLSLGSSGFKEITCSLVLRNVRNINLSPSVKSSFDYANLADMTSKGWFKDSLLCPDYTSKNNQRPVVYEGDTKSSSNYVVNAVAYPDGSMIVCRRGGVVAKVATDGTETTLMTISHASDWRLCWMDSNLNVFVSPHSSIDNGGSEIELASRGLYRLAYGGNSFEKVISLYNSSSSVTSETQNNDDTIWTMCEDNDGNLYAGVYAHTVRANPAVYKSTDGGETWTYAYNFVTSGVATSGKHIHDIIFNEYDNKLYCIVGEINEIYCSDDGSETWTAIGAQLEDYKGTALIAVPDGLLVGSDGAYSCIMSKVYADGKVRTKGKIWAGTCFGLRRSESGNIYAFTKIDSSVSSTSYYPPVDAISDPEALQTWKEGSPTYLSDWTKYNEWAAARYPDDAIRPQHAAILVSHDEGESWAVMCKFTTGSSAAFGFWTVGQFRNGECLAGFVGAGPAFAKPKVISEGKHKYGNSGLDLDGEIFIKLNSSTIVNGL